MDAATAITSGAPCVLVVQPLENAVDERASQQHDYTCARLATLARSYGVPTFAHLHDAGVYIVDAAYAGAKFADLLHEPNLNE